MSIFVNEDDSIKISVHYLENGDDVVVSDTPTEKTKTINVVCRRPDFAISQRLLSTSMSVDGDGNSSLNVMALQNNLIYFLAKSWDVKEPDTIGGDGALVPGKPVEMNAENIGKLRVGVARTIVNKLVAAVGQIF